MHGAPIYRLSTPRDVGMLRIRRQRRRFAPQNRRFVASALSATGTRPTLPAVADRRTLMKTINRLMILAAAVAVNAAALATVHVAMVAGMERALAANAEPEYVVINSPRTAQGLARTNCPAPKTL
jgi:hypothetical protein